MDLGQSTAAQRQQAALTLGHAEQALSVAENKLVRNQRDLSTAYVIGNVAVQGGALIRSADQLADQARTASDSATSALSVAATSIRGVASAFDTLASSIAGVHAIASNDDSGSAMARSAKRAEQATNDADGVVEQWKAASIAASIQSAKSIAASAATSVNAVGGEVQDLVDRAGALASATQQRVNDSMKQRAAAAQAERAAQMIYRQTKIDAEALDDGTTNLDLVLNGGLAVAVSSASAPAATGSATPAPPASPALTVTYTISGSPTDRCYFFALPVSDAPGFSYNDAKTAVIDLPLQSSAVGWTPTPGTQRSGSKGSAQTYVATIVTSKTVLDEVSGTTKTVAVAVGQAYRVFAYRVPLEGPYATNASDLSYPSRVVDVKNPIPNLSKYQASVAASPRLASTDASSPPRLSVQVNVPPDAPANLLEYRAFALLEDVYQAVKDDAAFLTGLLPPSSYKRVSAKTQGTINIAYREGDTDAYGDIVTADANYEVLIMLVPLDGDTTASALLLAQPILGSPASPSAPTSPGSSSSTSTRAQARTPAGSLPAGAPPAESAGPNAGQPAPGTGAK